MQKIVIILMFIVSLFFSYQVFASCVFLNKYETQTYKVVKTWNATHSYDENFIGCLAKIISNDKDELIAYISYDFICSSKNHYELNISQACCDTGRGGDYACGVIPKSFGLGKDFQTHLTASPTSKGNEADILNELMPLLASGVFIGSGGMVDRIASILKMENGLNFITPHLGTLKDMLKSSDYNTAINAAQILSYIPDNGLEKEIYNIYLKDRYGMDEQLRTEALEYFKSNPDDLNQETVHTMMYSNIWDKNVKDKEIFINLLKQLPTKTLEQKLDKLYKDLKPEEWEDLVCLAYQNDAIGYIEVKIRTDYNNYEHVNCNAQ